MSQKTGRVALAPVICISPGDESGATMVTHSTGLTTVSHAFLRAADRIREELIAGAQDRLLSARTEADQRAAAQRMAQLCAGRSDDQVARMERAKGLRR